MIDLQGIAGQIAQLMVILAFGTAVVGGLTWLLPRTPLGKANEKYVDALEGEGEVNRRTIARLESEIAEVRRTFDAFKVSAENQISALERDVVVAKAENDRLRAENGRMHDRLMAAGLDGDT
jgi:acetyl esterase/lipase